jgi:hypothetical protein
MKEVAKRAIMDIMALTCRNPRRKQPMSERDRYFLELSAFDLDVLEDVLRNAITERTRSRRAPNIAHEIGALRGIRRAIFAQEPRRKEAS